MSELCKQAIEKLNKEKLEAKDEYFADPIIAYLIERCKEDNGLVEDVCQEHKTWKKCLNYIDSKARKYLNNRKGCVPDQVVYEWAEDYYHKDDKAEEEQKAKEKAEREKAAKEKAKKAKTNTESKKTAANHKKTATSATKPKKQTKSNNIEGQASLFDLI
ncbi:MAG: Cas9 inhibitor AcrIIA9 family protein [Clostridia bacterium]|nr:Cas9 inhibitor AcrIIA9 family protein [Clostridia bacterium]